MLAKSGACRSGCFRAELRNVLTQRWNDFYHYVSQHTDEVTGASRMLRRTAMSSMYMRTLVMRGTTLRIDDDPCCMSLQLQICLACLAAGKAPLHVESEMPATDTVSHADAAADQAPAAALHSMSSPEDCDEIQWMMARSESPIEPMDKYLSGYVH